MVCTFNACIGLLWAHGSIAHVEMAQFQDGGSNQCISIYTQVILSLGNKCAHLKVHRAAYRAYPSLQ